MFGYIYISSFGYIYISIYKRFCDFDTSTHKRLLDVNANDDDLNTARRDHDDALPPRVCRKKSATTTNVDDDDALTKMFVLPITAEEEEEADVGGVVEQQQQRVSVRRVLARNGDTHAGGALARVREREREEDFVAGSGLSGRKLWIS